jgi:hypothetical protein
VQNEDQSYFRHCSTIEWLKQHPARASPLDFAPADARRRTVFRGLRPDGESLLDTRFLNATAVRGLALFDDPDIGTNLAASYRKFSPAERPAVMETLVSRHAFAKPLLEQIAAGKIPRADLTAFHARQIHP